MMTIDFDYKNPTDLIEEDHGKQREIFLRINWKEEEISVRTIAEHERNSMPYSVWNRIANEYQVSPNVDASELKNWVHNEIAPLAEKAALLFHTEYINGNEVGVWSDNDEGMWVINVLFGDIENRCYYDVPELQDGAGLRDVREWANVTKDELNVNTTDAEIGELVEKIENGAKSEDVVLHGQDLREYLVELRDRVRP